MNAHVSHLVDLEAIRTFLTQIHTAAAVASAGVHQPGMMQLVRIHPGTEDALTFQFAISEVELMAQEVIRQANAGFNVYVEGRTVRKRARDGKRRGTADDTVGVFALVVDDDADKGAAACVTAAPTLIIESSPGNKHLWYTLDRAVSAAEGKALGQALKANAGGDANTGGITQPYRVAGTPNFPNQRKVARGRVASPTGIISLDGPTYSPDAFRAAFPHVEPTRAHVKIPTGLTGRYSGTAEGILATPQEEVADRSAAFHRAAWKAFQGGLTADDFEALCRLHPLGPAAKFLERRDRLREEVERSFANIAATEATRETKEEAEPTYPDQREPLAAAEDAVRAIVWAFFDEQVPARQEEIAAWELTSKEAKARGEVPPRPPLPVAQAARIEPGIGKTDAAVKRAVEAVAAGLQVVFAVPNHPLADEMVERFDALGVEARVWRGYTQPDPEAQPRRRGPPQAMCLDLPAYEDAIAAGVSVFKSVCEVKTNDHRGRVRCRFAKRCGMQRQRKATLAIWIVTHASLFERRPKAIPQPVALIVDEGFAMGALPDGAAPMTLDAIEHASIDPASTSIKLGGNLGGIFSNAANDLELARCNLLRALREHGNGSLRREILEQHGITRDSAAVARGLEWGRLRDPGIVPGMRPKERRALAATVGQHNREVGLLAGLWAETRDFLDSHNAESGRLSIGYDKKAKARTLLRRSLKQVHTSWHAATLLLDGTLPAPVLLRAALGFDVQIRADVVAHWSPHVTVWQFVGAPVSAGKLDIIDRDGADETSDEKATERPPNRAVVGLLRHIRLRAAEVRPGTVGVIMPKGLEEKLTAHKHLPQFRLSPNVEVYHLGGVAGLDRLKDAAGLIEIGRLLPGPGRVEPLAGVVTGAVPACLPEPSPKKRGRGRWYPQIEARIRVADGTDARTAHIRHPDPVVEEVRHQICEAQLVQAVGRIRPHRRTAETPAFVDLISDVPLPITVDEVVTWEAPGEEADMMSEGVFLRSPSDMATVWPAIWANAEAAKKWAQRRLVAKSSGTSPYKEYFSIGERPRAFRPFRYKRSGNGQKWAEGAFDPAAIPDPKVWLEHRLGTLAGFEVDAVDLYRIAAGVPAPEPVPHKPVLLGVMVMQLEDEDSLLTRLRARPGFIPPRLEVVRGPQAQSDSPAGTSGQFLEPVGRAVA